MGPSTSVVDGVVVSTATLRPSDKRQTNGPNVQKRELSIIFNSNLCILHNTMEFNIEADTTGRKSRGRISLSVPRGLGTSSGKPESGPPLPGRIKIGKDHHSRIVALKVCTW